MNGFWEEGSQPNVALVADVPPAPWQPWVREEALSRSASRGVASRKRARFAYPDAGDGSETANAAKWRARGDESSPRSATATDKPRAGVFAYQAVSEDADSAWRSRGACLLSCSGRFTDNRSPIQSS